MADSDQFRTARVLRMIADFGAGACDGSDGIQAVLLTIEGLAPGAIDRAHAQLLARRLKPAPITTH